MDLPRLRLAVLKVTRKWRDRWTEWVVALLAVIVPWFVPGASVISYVIVAGIIAAYIIHVGVVYFRMRRTSTHASMLVWESTETFVHQAGIRDASVVGGAIELYSHPFASSLLSENGWSASDVSLKVVGLIGSRLTDPFPVSRGNKVNRKNYHMVRLPVQPSDQSGSLEAEFLESCFDNTAAAQDMIRDDEVLRHQFSDYRPEYHRVPNTTSIHGLVVLADQTIIVHKRSDVVEFHADRCSVSFEEQMNGDDVTDSELGRFPKAVRFDNFLRRALFEEVFPTFGASEAAKAQMTSMIDDTVSSANLWSAFFEEPSACFCLFVVYELRVTLAEYRELAMHFKQLGGTYEREGRLFCAPSAALTGLLSSKNVVVEGLLDSNARELVQPTQLHPSSAYRLKSFVDRTRFQAA